MTKKRTVAQKAADKLRTGRPPKQPAEKWSERVTVYMTPTERARLESLAEQEGVTLASLVMRPWREGE